ncbi:hypothetical protein DERP_000459 [Dermatophagoides pteronyssinus]|uniref:Uncharacterized protein n=1 Tax=Dermatophagoides pteronyssinus TaxID=6956 RepID=A0ABQ8J0S1_DERPT|nr:hypothetical protein DERP_000459 [Dermatophagoides pteronyssinus]
MFLNEISRVSCYIKTATILNQLNKNCEKQIKQIATSHLVGFGLDENKFLFEYILYEGKSSNMKISKQQQQQQLMGIL